VIGGSIETTYRSPSVLLLMFSLYHAASTIQAGSLLRSVLNTWAGLDLSARTLQSLSSRRYLATSHTYQFSVHYQEKLPTFLKFLDYIESISEYKDENLSAIVSRWHGAVGQGLLRRGSIPGIATTNGDRHDFDPADHLRRSLLAKLSTFSSST
jgi:hypothetical protein